MTTAGAMSATIRGRAPVILLSILLHVAILLPIGLAVPHLVRSPVQDDLRAIPFDLTPVPFRRARPASTDRGAETSGAAGASPSPLRPRLAATAPSSVVAPADGPVIEDQWRVQPAEAGQARRPLGRVANLPCPAPPGDRLGQRVCLTGSAMHRAEMPEGHADPLPSGPDRSEQNREDGFERQVQANEAWRSYTRGEGAYPGLRSLFRDR